MAHLAHIIPKHRFELPEAASDELRISVKIPTVDGADDFHRAILVAIGSDEEPGWDRLTDQLCGDQPQQAPRLVFVLTIEEDSDARVLALFLECLGDVAQFRGPNSVEVFLTGHVESLKSGDLV